MRIILLGAPGSGKGTQARKLVETYKVPQISTGDILRAAVSEGNEAGRRAEQIMKDGQLVPDDLVIELVSQRVLKADTRRGFILDGFPRNIPQAQELDTRLGWVSRPIQIAVNFEVDESSLLKRITGRRTCGNCGAIYNIHFRPPKTRGRCDECGESLVRRDDDTEETVRSRLEIYHAETEYLVQYYRAQHKLRTLNANGDTGDIFHRLCEMIDTEIRPLENKVVSVHGGEGSATHTQIVGGKIVREVAGTELRTTRVQPRPSPEGEVSTGADRAGAQGKSAARNAKPAKKAGAATAGTARKTAETARSAKAAASKPAASRATTAKKPAAKKPTAKKSTSKKATSKKSTAKKSTAKKSTTKKSASRKAAAKKSTKTAPSRKVAAKKTTKKAASKVVRKKTATKKTAANRKTTARKKTGAAAPARKKVQSKTTGRKAAARKKAAKTSTARRPATKKKPAAKKKTTTRRPATRKTTSARGAIQKTTRRTGAKKASTKKAGARKSSRRTTASRR